MKKVIEYIVFLLIAWLFWYILCWISQELIKVNTKIDSLDKKVTDLQNKWEEWFYIINE